MSNESLPVAVWEGELLGMRVAVLDDGTRIINTEDLERFFSGGADGADNGQLDSLAAFCRGKGVPE